MDTYTILCVASYVIGISAIAFSFYVQHLENLNRPAGYHLKATVEKKTDLKDRRKLDFAFFLNGRFITCSAFASLPDSDSVRVGRDYFIVYNDETGECVFNPCKKYRLWQLVLAGGGFIVTMFATSLVIEVLFI